LAGHGRGQAGKLKWAGAAWATGGLQAGPSEIDADAALWGLDPALFQPEGDEDGLWQDHIPALEAFLTVASQWRMIPRPDGTTLHQGLDYTAARMGFAMAGLKVPPEVWVDVQVIEAGAVAALNRRM
jgi:Phage related hypothetical protein (DUF1799)